VFGGAQAKHDDANCFSKQPVDWLSIFELYLFSQRGETPLRSDYCIHHRVQRQVGM
jgi:hypothetical protein